MDKSEQINSQVSSFMDGEIAQDEVALLCKRMANSSELRERWQEYHLISDALKQQLPEQPGIDLSMRVKEAIQDEPLFFAKPKQAQVSAIKRFSGLAVAASVAVFGVVVVLNSAVQPNGDEVMLLAKNEPNSSITQVAAISKPANTTIQAMDPRLNKYLVDHSEYAVNASVHGVLPYARIVGQQQVRK